MSPVESKKRKLPWIPGAILICGLAGWLIWSATGRLRTEVPSGSKTHQADATLLTLLPQHQIDLGKVPSGSFHRTTIWLQNERKEIVNVTATSSSSPFVRVLLPAKAVYPGEKIGALVETDLAKEPGLSGAVNVDVSGSSDRGQSAFTCKLVMNVTE